MTNINFFSFAKTMNILLINSIKNKTVPLADFFKKLNYGNGRLYLFSAQSGLLEYFKQNHWPAKKIYFGTTPENNIKAFLFAVELPFLSILYFLYLLHFKNKISAIVCLGLNDKVIFTPLARLLKIKLIWLEFIETDYLRLPKISLALYKNKLKYAQIAVFNHQTAIQLQLLGANEENIKFIPFGIELNQHKFQGNIFNELAQMKSGSARKYFTIGTIADLNNRQNLKNLFGAVKICLSVIPDIQLVIIGDGEQRRDLIWLAKKMEIENYIWLVGKQQHLKKWFDNFHIFAVAGEKPDLNDFSIILKAMSAPLPIIGISNIGLEDLVELDGQKCGILTDNGNNEELAQSIIKFQQNENLRREMGRIAKEKVDKLFNIDRMVEEFELLVNN